MCVCVCVCVCACACVYIILTTDSPNPYILSYFFFVPLQEMEQQEEGHLDFLKKLYQKYIELSIQVNEDIALVSQCYPSSYIRIGVA